MMRRSSRGWLTTRWGLVILLVLAAGSATEAAEGHGVGKVHDHQDHQGGQCPVGFGFGFVSFQYTPNFVFFNSGSGFVGPPPQIPIVAGPVGGGLMLPQPQIPNQGWPQALPQKIRPEPAKSDGLVTIGDRLFRAGNYRRAEDRYEQARRANPNSATPVVRLAQLALVRGFYKEAAEQFRAAMVAEPGWHVNAPDIQALYAEPADFARVISKLESHLQASPGDRDAWLVLGAQLYLSGKTRQAGDVFKRLHDRKPDQVLASFLDATTLDPPPKPQ